MPDPIDPTRTSGLPQSRISSGAADETAALLSDTDVPRDPTFGPPAVAGEVGTLGPFRVVRQLGRGGMGAVYLALDTRLNRKLALKVMLPAFAASGQARERFLREARAAAQVTHDNVVTIYDADERDGVPYITMQFLQGHPLDGYLKTRGAPPLHHVLRIAGEAALGLAAAHALGLVHRDIKPANLWLEAPDGRVKVLDFGLAKPVGTDAGLTRSGAVVGTPAYMSPEQAGGEWVDHRTDLFSLGSVLYRLCTGRAPFHSPSVVAVLLALRDQEPVPVRELNPNVPEALAALIHQLLAKKPGDRPQTAAEVAQRLRAIRDQHLAVPSAAAPGAVVPAGADLSTSMPVVVYPVPVQPMEIAARSESAFENLGADETGAEGVVAAPKPARKQSAGKGTPATAVGIVLLAALLAAGAVIAIRNEDRGQPKNGAADGATAGSPKDGKTVLPVKPPAATDEPDRKAAEYAFFVGGGVGIDADGKERAITAAAELPKGAFRLTLVNLRSKKQVADESLAVFKDCKSLADLNLGFTAVTDAGLAHLKDCKGLTRLDLMDIPVTDAGLAHLKNCTNLTDLNLAGTRVTDAGLAHFKDCANLKELHLVRTALTDVGLGHLKNHKNLTVLHLQSTRVTNAGLAHLEQCPRLADLNLNITQVTDAGLVHLKNCKELTQLTLNTVQITDAGLVHLTGVERLSRLFLKGTRVTARGAGGLAEALPWCRIVWDGGTIEATDPDRKAVEYIRSINGGMTIAVDGKERAIGPTTELPGGAIRLVGIQLGGNRQATDAGLAVLKDCRGLANVSLYSTALADATLAHVADSTSLTTLNLHKTQVTNAGLAHLKSCPNLAILFLEHTRVTDAGLVHLDGCTKLTKVNLSLPGVTDAGLAHLKNCKELTQLFLENAAVTDAGLAHLAGFGKLTALDLTKTRVTATGVEELAKALPKCHITWDGGTVVPNKK